MSEQTVHIDVEPPIAVITVDRPRRLNALSSATLRELLSAARALGEESDVRAVILTGAGDRAFIAGEDVTEMAAQDFLGALRFAGLGQDVCAALERMPQPVIAAVHGYALGGGCELACACDFIYASDEAVFGQPEVNMGVIPSFGGLQRLLRRVPTGVARELVLTGRPIDAAEALRIGLVNAVLPAAELMPRVREVAAEIAEKGPLAVARAKRLLITAEDVPAEAAQILERQAFAGLFATEDQKEGMRAFLEKRPAAFKGR